MVWNSNLFIFGFVLLAHNRPEVSREAVQAKTQTFRKDTCCADPFFQTTQKCAMLSLPLFKSTGGNGAKFSEPVLVEDATRLKCGCNF